MSDAKFKIIFDPSILENWDGTQEELDQFISEITTQIESVNLEDLPVIDDSTDIEDYIPTPSRRTLH